TSVLITTLSPSLSPSPSCFSLAVFFFVALPLPRKVSPCKFMSDKGQPLPKFGEWDVNDPASAEGFTVIFNKARDEKKTGGNPESPGKVDSQSKPAVDVGKPQAKKWFCCLQDPPTHS
ncbi:hypothetical protein F2P56_021025, partial [Juglans regia]